MRQENANDIYIFFDQFVDEFLLTGNSILTNDNGILTKATIQNCITNYVENYKEGGDSFGEKVADQFKISDLPTRLVFAHAEWLWAFAVDDITVKTKKEQTKRTTKIDDDSKLKPAFPVGFGSAGMYHKNNKYDEIKFNLLLIQFLKDKIDTKEINTSEQVKSWIEKVCLYQKYEQEFKEYPIPEELVDKIPSRKLAMCNILCHVAFPDKYERIASDNHKWQILNSFSGLLTNEQKENDSLNIDEKILIIRNELAELTYPEFDFYEDDFAQVWNYSLTEEGFSEVQGLRYKKAIILYGPPGTSKTHSAKRLANALITNTYLSKKENVIKYFKEEEDFINGRIHHLQLHPNYTYEDFIAGIQLKDHATEVVKGKLFLICEAALTDKADNQIDDMPHVLILDEINRIDLSRLFGEVFSALENRDESIEIGIGNLSLSIPRNLYVIGTMNEIDFSLERIDFALRRRFLWFFYGFDRSILEAIFWEKDKQQKTKLKEEEAERFFSNTSALNKAITEMPELGEQYQIGHTFFSEIVNIYKHYKELNGYTRLQKQLYRNQGPAQILWEISIAPILKAFLGNMDKAARDEKIAELSKIYNS